MEIRLPDSWHKLLHRLWSKAVGTPNYAKSEWIELETILFQAAAVKEDKKRSAAAG